MAAKGDLLLRNDSEFQSVREPGKERNSEPEFSVRRQPAVPMFNLIQRSMKYSKTNK